MPFAEVVGHARPLGLLSRSIARGSLPPSLLFTGPEGVGKRQVALAVAQALNCVSPVVRGEVEGDTASGKAPALPRDACGVCPACRRISRGTHPDVVLVEPGDNGGIKIEPIREVIAAAGYRPFEGRRRVVIVDDADRVNADAQDALLKSLEEPPASSVFVLVSSRPETLLATVRSRCSRLRFGRLDAGDVARVLVERHQFEDREAHAAAAVADGSPGRALEAASDGFQESREAALGALRLLAGSRSPRESLGAAALLIAGKSTAAREREALTTRLQMLASLLRDVALLDAGAHDRGEGGGMPAGRLANADLGEDLAELAGRLGGARALRAFGVADRAALALARNANPKVVADWVAVRF
jgi:DNA polymerase III subunit delta'